MSAAQRTESSTRDPDPSACGAWGPTMADGRILRCEVQAGHRAAHVARDPSGERIATWTVSYEPLKAPNGEPFLTLPETTRGMYPHGSIYREYDDVDEFRDVLDAEHEPPPDFGRGPRLLKHPGHLELACGILLERDAFYEWADRLAAVGLDPTRCLLEASHREALLQGWLSP